HVERALRDGKAAGWHVVSTFDTYATASTCRRSRRQHEGGQTSAGARLLPRPRTCRAESAEAPRPRQGVGAANRRTLVTCRLPCTVPGVVCVTRMKRACCAGKAAATSVPISPCATGSLQDWPSIDSCTW